MAIHIFCTECKASYGLDAKRCTKCGKKFGRDRKYRVSVSVKGVRATRVVDNLTIARETEAALKADMLRDEYDISCHKVKKVITLGKLWDEHYLSWAKTNKAKSWMTDDFFYRKHLKPGFGSKALDGISSFDVERIKSEMKQAITPQKKLGYSDATIRHVLVLLGSLYNKAIEWKLYEGENPVKTVKKPRLNNKITEFFNDDEMGRLFDTLDNWPCKRSADFVRIALFTGIRKSEVLKLRWDAVNLEHKILTLKDPKSGLDEHVPLSDEAVEVFRGIERSSEFVIPGGNGEQKKTFRRAWYRIRKAAGLPDGYRFHGLRHNFASHLVSEGEDLYVVSKLLTHKDLRTSERYAHLAPSAVKRAAARSGNLLSKAKQAKPEADVIPIKK